MIKMYEYEFGLADGTIVYFTEDSRIEFYKDDEKIFSMDPADLSVINLVYNHMQELFKKYREEDDINE